MRHFGNNATKATVGTRIWTSCCVIWFRFCSLKRITHSFMSEFDECVCLWRYQRTVWLKEACVIRNLFQLHLFPALFQVGCAMFFRCFRYFSLTYVYMAWYDTIILTQNKHAYTSLFSFMSQRNPHGCMLHL